MDAGTKPLSLAQRFQAVAAEYMASIDPEATEAELAFKSADGRRSVIAINIVKPESKLGGTHLRILALLAKNVKPLTRKDIWKAMHLKSGEGKFGLRVNELLSRKLIFERDGVLVDDVKKFETA